MKEELKKILLELAAVPGVSGHEGPIARTLKSLFEPSVDDVRIDPMGNVIARKNGSAPGPKLMLACHSDTIGCIVRSIDKNGFMRLFRMGGAVDLLLVGRKVWVNDVPGVMGVRPGHIQRPEETRIVPHLADLYVDVGAGSADEVAKLGIEIGSPVRYHSPIEEMSDSDLLCGAYVDNRIGCAVLVYLMSTLGPDFAGSIYAVATTHEETGWRGGQMSAFTVDPDLAVAIDTTPAGGTPDVDFERELPIEIGLGPVLQVASQGSGAGFTAHPAVSGWLRSAAERSELPYQLAALQNANTDAVLIHMARGGIPTAALTIPRRYSHSPVELFNINDAATTVRILQNAIAQLGALKIQFSEDG
jgi:endoglucanase